MGGDVNTARLGERILEIFAKVGVELLTRGHVFWLQAKVRCQKLAQEQAGAQQMVFRFVLGEPQHLRHVGERKVFDLAQPERHAGGWRHLLQRPMQHRPQLFALVDDAGIPTG